MILIFYLHAHELLNFGITKYNTEKCKNQNEQLDLSHT